MGNIHSDASENETVEQDIKWIQSVKRAPVSRMKKEEIERDSVHLDIDECEQDIDECRSVGTTERSVRDTSISSL